MSWIKNSFKIIAGMIIAAVIALGLFFFSASQASNEKSRMINELAKIPAGSSVDDVMKLADGLGINFSSKEFAIPSVVQMKNEDSPQTTRELYLKVTKDTDLSKFKNGTLNFGLSLFFFQRQGCEITFKDGTVQKTRIWTLD